MSRSDFHDFCNGYIHAALWSSTDQSDESGGEPLDANYSEDDIAPSSMRAGFWDREGVDRALGDRLSKASRKFASDLYVGDDGQIYVSPERK